MKNTLKTLTCALVCIVVACPLFAQEIVNIAGKWEMTNETPRGTQKTTFTFEQEGNVVTGTVMTPRGDVPISSGKVEGNTVTFTIVRGRDNHSMETTYIGTLEGDTISGRMSTPRGDREFTMKRAEG